MLKGKLKIPEKALKVFPDRLGSLVKGFDDHRDAGGGDGLETASFDLGEELETFHPNGFVSDREEHDASSGFNSTIALFLSLIVVFHLPPTFSSEFFSISPLIPPTFGDVCKQVSCGNGNCRLTKNSTVPFECVCHPGWKQPTSVNGFHFLPCVIPNCIIDISCSQAASPAAAINNTTKGSIFDPCSWNICGDGTCKKSSPNSSYSCLCSKGYNNLMNSTSLPCYPECALGGDCPKLGIPLFNQSTAPSPTLNNVEDTTNLARSLQHEKLYRIIILLVLTPITILA